MKTVFLYPNIHKSSALQIANSIREYLSRYQIVVACSDELANDLQALPVSIVDPKDVLAVIAIGGDGTILRMAKEFPDWSYPVLGINLGSLGFMTDVPVTDLYPSLEDLVQGRFSVQKRMMLEVCTRNSVYYAINDACLHRGRFPGLVEMSVHIDDKFVCTVNADGLILATPNGSTAYSLSAGGPIVMPELDCYVLTPICPHTLSNRPLVVSSNSHIQVDYIGHEIGLDLAIDGFIVEQLNVGDRVQVSRAQRPFQWINLSRHDYYQTIRSKLGWHSQPRIMPSR